MNNFLFKINALREQLGNTPIVQVPLAQLQSQGITDILKNLAPVMV